MKPIITAVMLLATATLFTGCFKQDTSFCRVDENCVLMFELEASSGSADFAATIQSIDVALFDQNGDFVTHERIEKSALDEFRGVRLKVDPGKYYVVAWGNVSSCSEVSTNNGVPPTRFADSYLHTVSGETGCNLYYAPSKPVEIRDPASNSAPDYSRYEVEVVANDITRRTLDFVRANRRLYVYLKGFDVVPQVQLGHFPDKYDYYLRTFETRKDFRQSTVLVEHEQTGEVLDRAAFRGPIVPIEDEMTLSLIASGTRAGEVIKTINLKQWYEENKDSIPDPNRISIVCTNGIDGDISFEVAAWKDDDVKPIW